MVGYNFNMYYCIFPIILHQMPPSFPLLVGRRGHDRMVVGFTITCAISAYHF